MEKRPPPGHQHRGKRDQYRGKKPDKLGRWRSADVRHYSANPADAYLIAPRMKELGLWERYVKELSRVARVKGLPYSAQLTAGG
jgi:hypothetical protein